MQNQKNPATFTTSFRGDICQLATIVNWMIQTGETPKSRNKIINTAISLVCNQITQTNPELVVQTVGEALELLTSHGLTGENLKKTNKNLAQALWNEDQQQNQPIQTVSTKLPENELDQLLAAGQQALERMKKQRVEQVNQNAEKAKG